MSNGCSSQLSRPSLEIAFFINRTERLAWRGYQRETARNAAQSITNLLARTDDALTLANSLSEGEPARWSRAMSRLFQQYPYILEIIRLDAGGQVLSVVADSSHPGWMTHRLQENSSALLAGRQYASGRWRPGGKLRSSPADHRGALAAQTARSEGDQGFIRAIPPGFLLEGQGGVIVYGEQVQPGNLGYRPARAGEQPRHLPG
jgi:hypothetical protein